MILEALKFFFVHFMFGSVFLYGLFILGLHLIINLFAKTPKDSLIAFMILPMWAMTQNGVLSGYYSFGVYFLMIIMIGYTLADRILKVFGITF